MISLAGRWGQSRTLQCVLFAIAFLLSFSPAFAQEKPEYVLGAEDEIAITVVRHPEFSKESLLVPQSGIIQVPVAGEVSVLGMSLAELQRHILHKLRDRLRNPEVSVTLIKARMKRVYVLGDVKLPGVFDLKDGWGVAEGLSAAGGLALGVQLQDCTVVLERATGGERVRVPLDDALNGKAKETIKLQPGDVLRVEAIATLPVYVTGKVKNPGQYRLRADSTGVLEAVAQAGGVLDGAAVAGVRIIRLTGEEETVDLTQALTKDSTLEPKAAAKLPKLNGGDIVLIPESLDRFAILGYVQKPGFYPIPNGRKYTLTEAVAVAEGADKRGRLSRIGLVRMENGKEVRRIYDLGKYLQRGDVKQNPDIMPGDVIFIPETNRVDIATVLTGISSTAIFFNAFRR